MRRATWILVLLLTLDVGQAEATVRRYEFYTPESQIAVICGFGICDDVYSIEGLFGLDIDFTSDTALFVDVDAAFAGTGVFDGRSLDTVLGSQLIGSVVNENTIIFGRGSLPPPKAFQVTINDNLLLLTGGYDDTPFDGEAVTIDARALRLSAEIDFDGDGDVDVDDVDALVNEIITGNNSALIDLTGDDVLNGQDLEQWLVTAAEENGFGAPYLIGDANLDGSVNASDLNALGQNWRGHPKTWQLGDFTADGTVDASDLNQLAQNWQTSIPLGAAQATAVPEPASYAALILAIVMIVLRRRQ